MSGLDKLQKELEKKLKQSGSAKVICVVGYTQSYALQVHEIPARHKAGKQHKYLEGPAREQQQQIADIVSKNFNEPLEKRMLRAGLYLQRISQEVVPIDTGALKNSAFTSLEVDADSKAEEAYQRSEAIRIAELRRRERAHK